MLPLVYIEARFPNKVKTYVIYSFSYREAKGYTWAPIEISHKPFRNNVYKSIFECAYYLRQNLKGASSFAIVTP